MWLAEQMIGNRSKVARCRFRHTPQGPGAPKAVDDPDSHPANCRGP
jgi:hypothetical protein